MPLRRPILPDSALMMSWGASMAMLMMLIFFFAIGDPHSADDVVAGIVEELVEGFN